MGDAEPHKDERYCLNCRQYVTPKGSWWRKQKLILEYYTTKDFLKHCPSYIIWLAIPYVISGWLEPRWEWLGGFWFFPAALLVISHVHEYTEKREKICPVCHSIKFRNERLTKKL